MLEEQDIRAFVHGTTRYFEVAAQQAASVGSPSLVTEGAPEIHDYNGVIAVSGRRLCDLVGEVANTIAGNVRRDLGKDFAISVPSVVTGAGNSVDLPAGGRPVVIPIHWRSHVAKLVVCLQ